MEGLQREIEAIEAEISGVDASLCAPGSWADTAALATRRRALEARVEALYTEWEAAEADLLDQEATG